MARSTIEWRVVLARSEGEGNPAINIRVLSRYCSHNPFAWSSRSVHVRVESGVSCWKQKTGHPSDRYTLVTTLSVISSRRSPITVHKSPSQWRNGRSTFDTRKLLKTLTSAQRSAERPGPRALRRPSSSRGFDEGTFTVHCEWQTPEYICDENNQNYDQLFKPSNQCVPANRPFFMVPLRKRCDALRDRRPL